MRTKFVFKNVKNTPILTTNLYFSRRLSTTYYSNTKLWVLFLVQKRVQRLKLGTLYDDHVDIKRTVESGEWVVAGYKVEPQPPLITFWDYRVHCFSTCLYQYSMVHTRPHCAVPNSERTLQALDAPSGVCCSAAVASQISKQRSAHNNIENLNKF